MTVNAFTRREQACQSNDHLGGTECVDGAMRLSCCTASFSNHMLKLSLNKNWRRDGARWLLCNLLLCSRVYNMLARRLQSAANPATLLGSAASASLLPSSLCMVTGWVIHVQGGAQHWPVC